MNIPEVVLPRILQGNKLKENILTFSMSHTYTETPEPFVQKMALVLLLLKYIIRTTWMSSLDQVSHTMYFYKYIRHQLIFVYFNHMTYMF